MDRRKFLEIAAIAGIGVAAPVSFAGARDERYDGPYYAVFNASGGWDTTYLMDPKGVGGLNRLYDASEIRSAGAIHYAPTEGRIASGAMDNRTFFERYGSELLVVNGIDISVNNHSPCSSYVATGKLGSLRYPTFAALVAAARCADVPLAFLTFGQYSGTGNLVPASRLPYMNRLKDLAMVDYADSAGTRPYHHATVRDHVERALSAVESDGHSLPRLAHARSFLYAAQVSSKSLARVVPHIPSTVPSLSEPLKLQSEIALASFAAGLAVSANLSLSTFDSHDDNDPDQMAKIPELLAGIDYMLTRAEEVGLRDRLVVIIQSEMGRTPWYNAGDGKDHWSINSMMAIGPGIAGNRVVGATRVDSTTGHDQAPAPVDPASLTLDDAGIRMRPEHIHQALRELASIDDHPLSSAFPLDVPDEERLVGLFG